MIRAMLWKEWREQRWRFALAGLVMASMSASLVRAQLLTTAEAVALVFGPVGLLLTVFMAMGSVATERADGTWPFLVARPLRRADVLRLKWVIGAAELLATFLIAGAAAHWAAWSRHLFALPPVPPDVAQFMRSPVPAGNSAAWLWGVVLLSAISMLAWYTTLFFILTRARDELHAGLCGVLLTLVALAWLAQYPVAKMPISLTGWETGQKLLWVSATINPLSPLAFLFESVFLKTLAASAAIALWVVGPVWLIGRFEPARGRS